MPRWRPLSIHEKTFAVFGVSFVCLIVALYSLTSHFLLGGFAAVEERETRVNVTRVQTALEDSVSRLDTTVGDWAGWDAAYSFIAGQNPTYISDSLTPESIGGIGVNVIVFLRPNGEIYFGNGYDPAKGELSPLPAGLTNHLRPGSALVTHHKINSVRSGLLVLPSGVWMIASRPILTSEKRGPIRGTLIMGKRLDRNEMSRLSHLTEIAFMLHASDDTSARGEIRVEPVSDDTILGKTVLLDVYGNPTVNLQVKLPRSTWRQGQDSLKYVLLTMISLCLACGAVSLWVIERMVLRRLRLLSSQVRTVSRAGDFTRRISLPGVSPQSPSIGGDELGTLAMTVNDLLTAVERSGKSLQESENRFRTFMDNSPTVVFIKDAAGRLVYVNGTYERRLNRQAEDVYGKTDFEIWPEETALRLRANDDIVRRERRAVQTEESTPTPTGKSDWLTFKFPLVDANGEVFVAGMAVDITERKTIERMKSEFVSVVSHELRTPVTSIRGALGLVLGGVTGELQPKTKDLLQIACSNADRLTQLLNDILDMEKIESGKMALSWEPQDLSSLIRKSTELNAHYATGRNLSLVIQSEIPSARVCADADRFLQVMANLLSNASKFAEPGQEIHINTERLPGNTHEGNGAAPPRWVRVSVTNYGPIIPLEFHSRIFNRFAQADASSTRSKGGTGLGLSISKAIIERMNGYIGFTSTEEDGTTFYFDLPEYVRDEAPVPAEIAVQVAQT